MQPRQHRRRCWQQRSSHKNNVKASWDICQRVSWSAWSGAHRPASTRPCSVTRPVSLSSLSTTGRKVILRGCSIALIASTAFSETRMVEGAVFITCAIGISSMSAPCACSARRRSPSVKVPSRLFSASRTSTQPQPLPDSSTSVSTTFISAETTGSRSPVIMTSSTDSMRRLPMRPAGWFIAYWSLERLRDSMREMATVSPKSIWMAVEVTGARSKGHSSRSRGRWIAMSEAASSLLPFTEVTLTRVAPLARA
mmetsp:Transcript_12664/g.31965  ORF Transcript_12664/g.31965 Transcript_12664/m.31965 type:complete len:253 (+) Transcript_12664:80-838(+)